jgi:hypothetical protein
MSDPEKCWTCTTRNPENGSCGSSHNFKATDERRAARKGFGKEAVVVDGKVYTEMLGFVGWISPARGFV